MFLRQTLLKNLALLALRLRMALLVALALAVSSSPVPRSAVPAETPAGSGAETQGAVAQVLSAADVGPSATSEPTLAGHGDAGEVPASAESGDSDDRELEPEDDVLAFGSLGRSARSVPRPSWPGALLDPPPESDLPGQDRPPSA